MDHEEEASRELLVPTLPRASRAIKCALATSSTIYAFTNTAVYIISTAGSLVHYTKLPYYPGKDTSPLKFNNLLSPTSPLEISLLALILTASGFAIRAGMGRLPTKLAKHVYLQPPQYLPTFRQTRPTCHPTLTHYYNKFEVLTVSMFKGLCTGSSSFMFAASYLSQSETSFGGLIAIFSVLSIGAIAGQICNYWDTDHPLFTISDPSWRNAFSIFSACAKAGLDGPTFINQWDEFLLRQGLLKDRMLFLPYWWLLDIPNAIGGGLLMWKTYQAYRGKLAYILTPPAQRQREEAPANQVTSLDSKTVLFGKSEDIKSIIGIVALYKILTQIFSTVNVLARTSFAESTMGSTSWTLLAVVGVGLMVMCTNGLQHSFFASHNRAAPNVLPVAATACHAADHNTTPAHGV